MADVESSQYNTHRKKEKTQKDEKNKKEPSLWVVLLP